MVGAAGFEPATPWSQTRCATRLRQAPPTSGSHTFSLENYQANLRHRSEINSFCRRRGLVKRFALART